MTGDLQRGWEPIKGIYVKRFQISPSNQHAAVGAAARIRSDRMNSRQLLVFATGNSLLAGAAQVRAQILGVTSRRVGVFTPGSRSSDDFLLKPFYDELHQFGWVRNISYDRVFADDRADWVIE